MTIHQTSTRGGAQTVDKACELLRELARTGIRGARMTDLCNTSGLNRPTAHRIIKSLQSAGLVQQYQESRRYALGSGMFELGMASPNPVEKFPQVRSVVEELAATTEDTVYLMLRSYTDVMCAWLAQGAYPIKPTLVPLGSRRPLPASMAGLAILATLPKEESAELIEQCSSALSRYCRMSAVDASRLVEEGRDQGYTYGTNAVIDGITAVGIAVPSNYDRPYMAISVSAVSSRIPPTRVPELVSRMRGAASKIAGMTQMDSASRSR